MPPKKPVDEHRINDAMRTLRDETNKSDLAYNSLADHSDFVSDLSQLVSSMPGMPLSPFVQLAASGVAAVGKKIMLKMQLGKDYYSRGNNPYCIVIASAAGLKSFVESIGGAATVKEVLAVFAQSKSNTFRNMVKHHKQYENGVVGQNVVANISSSSMAIDIKENPKINNFVIFSDEATHIRDMMRSPASQHDKRIYLQGWTMGAPFSKKDGVITASVPNFAIGLYLMGQPTILLDLIELESGSGGGNGFLPRFVLLSYARSPTEWIPNSSTDIEAECKKYLEQHSSEEHTLKCFFTNIYACALIVQHKLPKETDDAFNLEQNRYIAELRKNKIEAKRKRKEHDDSTGAAVGESSQSSQASDGSEMFRSPGRPLPPKPDDLDGFEPEGDADEVPAEQRKIDSQKLAWNEQLTECFVFGETTVKAMGAAMNDFELKSHPAVGQSDPVEELINVFNGKGKDNLATMLSNVALLEEANKLYKATVDVYGKRPFMKVPTEATLRMFYLIRCQQAHDDAMQRRWRLKVGDASVIMCPLNEEIHVAKTIVERGVETASNVSRAYIGTPLDLAPPAFTVPPAPGATGDVDKMDKTEAKDAVKVLMQLGFLSQPGEFGSGIILIYRKLAMAKLGTFAVFQHYSISAKHKLFEGPATNALVSVSGSASDLTVFIKLYGVSYATDRLSELLTARVPSQSSAMFVANGDVLSGNRNVFKRLGALAKMFASLLVKTKGMASLDSFDAENFPEHETLKELLLFAGLDKDDQRDSTGKFLAAQDFFQNVGKVSAAHKHFELLAGLSAHGAGSSSI